MTLRTFLTTMGSVEGIVKVRWESSRMGGIIGKSRFQYLIIRGSQFWSLSLYIEHNSRDVDAICDLQPSFPDLPNICQLLNACPS